MTHLITISTRLASFKLCNSSEERKNPNETLSVIQESLEDQNEMKFRGLIVKILGAIAAFLYKLLILSVGKSTINLKT